MAQQKKTPTKKSAAKKTPAAKAKAAPRKTAAQKKQEEQAALEEATLQERIKSEILGVVLIALSILFALYLYFTPDNPLGTVLNRVLYASTGMVALGLPPVFLLMGILAIAGRKRSPVAGRTAVTLVAISLPPHWSTCCAKFLILSKAESL